MSRLRKTVLAGVVAAVSIVPLSGLAMGSPTLAVHDCNSAKKKPSKILFACADGNYRVNHLDWSEWHKKKAVADGVFHMNDCTPSCAEGTFHKRAGTLILKGRMWCNNIHEHVFRRAHYEYVMPFQGESEGGFELSCPF